jgi:peptide/nickel transport system substrate-binding protein
MIRKTGTLGVLAALVVALLSTAALASKKDNTVRFAHDTAPENLDAYFNDVRSGVIVAHHVWSNLIFRDPKTNEYKGELAKSWKWVDDKTLELELREGVKFHNGAPFVADDVVYTLNFVSKPENKAKTQQNVNWIESVEKLGDHKVRIHTRAPFPAAIEYLAGPVVIYPHEYYEKVGPAGMSDKPIGSGPYKVVEHIPGKLVRMERNPDYFKDSPLGQPAIDKLEYRFIPDRNTQLAELMGGGLDWIWYVTPDQAQQLKAMPNVNVVSGETMRIAFLRMAASPKGPVDALKDVRVRRAINHAIDRDAIVKNLVGEGSRVLYTNCFPPQFGCTDEGAMRYPYDPQKAKQLLAEAGFPNGIDLDLIAYRDRSQTEAVIGYLRAVGVRANLRFMDYAAQRDLMRQDKAGISHDTWGSFSVNDVSASVSHYFKGGADDVARDPQLKEWLTVADGSTDPEVRKENYKKALDRIAEQAYTVPLFSLPAIYVFDKQLDFTPFPDEIPRFFMAKWK